MIAVDTSVVVAAFAPWHEAHRLALRALTQEPRLPAHAGIETYSTLTRLPEPFRAPAPVVADFLAARFGRHWLSPSAATLRALPRRLAAVNITGGACYDALVAATATQHRASLLTLDERAEPTYRRLRVDYAMLT